jgi:hypothetical protein
MLLPMPWYDEPVRRSRAYLFRSRRCRQRIAQGLGAGLPAGVVARIERIGAPEVETLLGDASFRALVGHYEALAALPEAAKLQRLVELAGAMLERLVATGDLRAIAFVLHEARRGQDPRRKLAESVIAAEAKLRHRPVPAEPAAGPRPKRASAIPADWPRPRATAPAAACSDAFAFCAAVQPDHEAAADLAAAEVRNVEARLRRAAATLRAKLTREAERAGTALAGEECQRAQPEAWALPAEAARIGAALHAEVAAAVTAADAVHQRRCAFAAGEPPETGDLAGPAPPAARPAAPEPPVLPDWLDRVDARIKATALACPEAQRGWYLARIAALHGFDTS